MIENGRTSAVLELEKVDGTLRGLCAAIDVMRMGCAGMAGGDTMDDILGHIRASLQIARAKLDGAAAAAMAARGG